MKTIPIFGTGIRSVSPYITAQRRVNVFYDIRKDDEKEKVSIYTTPGLTLFVTLPTLPIRGMLQVGLYAFAVAGNTLYVITPGGSFAALGQLNTITPTNISMAANETQLCIVDGSFGYVLNNVPGLINLISNNSPVQKAQTLAGFQFIRDITYAIMP